MRDGGRGILIFLGMFGYVEYFVFGWKGGEGTGDVKIVGHCFSLL